MSKTTLRGVTQVGEEELFTEEFLKKLEYLAIVSRKLQNGLLQAQRRTKKVGSGVEFADHRTYSHGDDMRYLDWSVYGRSEKLLLRLFQEEEDLSIYFLVDVSSSMRFGNKLRYAKQIVAALGYVGLANLDRVGIVPFSGNISKPLPPSRGKGQIFKILDFLRAVGEQKGITNTKASVTSFALQHKRRGLAIVLSDFYDPQGYQEGLTFLRYHRYETIAIHIHDPEEATPEINGDVEIVDCESGEAQPVTISAAVLESFRREYEKYLEEVKSFCTSKQIAYVRASVTQPFDELVLTLFREGGLVT